VAHLLLAAQAALLVAPAVADPQVAAARGSKDLVGAPSRVSASGFSTSTGLPSESALQTGATCSCSGVETITAVTCG
jgi:hypothetical protein